MYNVIFTHVNYEYKVKWTLILNSQFINKK